MSPTRLVLISALALSLAASAADLASAAPTPRSGPKQTSTSARPGCSVVTDAGGDTAADIGAPATLPQADEGLDLTAVDLASNTRWIGARVRLFQLDATAPKTGGESFEVSFDVSGGTLVMGVGRYANATGISGDDKYAYAGFRRGTVAPRDVPARAVQLAFDPVSRGVSVFVERKALSDIGAVLSGSVSNISATSGRQYGDEATVGYDQASGPGRYRLGSASCLALPS